MFCDPSRELPVMNFAEFRPGDQKIYVSDIRKAQTLLGWAPSVKIAEGLGILIDNWKLVTTAKAKVG